MVIQRWQSVLLFLAAIMMALFSFSTLATVAPSTHIVVADFAGLLIVSILTMLLLLVSIFLYGDLHRQIRVVKINALLLAAVIVTEVLSLTNIGVEMSMVNIITILLPLGAAILDIFALRLIKSDHRKLTSYDRLR